jgi:CRP/FNR family transcriptional regulator, cyclic AMP receptor protein
MNTDAMHGTPEPARINVPQRRGLPGERLVRSVAPARKMDIDADSGIQRKKALFDVSQFLGRVHAQTTSRSYTDRQIIFAQGEPADAVFYIESGKVKLTVVSNRAKEAVIAILEKGSFFGEGSLAGQSLRISSAYAMQKTRLVRTRNETMASLLQSDPVYADHFLKYVLSRNIRMEEDLVDHLFNSSEKRLARLLLLLAHHGKESKREPVVPKLSQETLAEMIGTTRSRVGFFLKRFRKMGLIDYEGGLHVNETLLTVVLRDEF